MKAWSSITLSYGLNYGCSRIVGSYNIVLIRSGGRPMIALLPFITIGRSINFGCSTMALINSSLDRDKPLYLSFQIPSFLRMSSMGEMSKRAIMPSRSVTEGASTR